MENQEQKLIEINLQAFVCEMRAFPFVEIENPLELMRNYQKLSVVDQNKLGLALYLGQGLMQDRESAVEVWQNAGDAESLLYLSVDRFFQGDKTGGVDYLSKAAKAGNVLAQLRYAYCLILGIGVSADMGKAFKIIDKLAHDKVPCAVYFLGAMYMTKAQDLVEYDVEKGKKLLAWSVAHGCKFAQFEQGVVDLRTAKTAEEKQQAFALIRAAAEQGEPRAMFMYAIELSRGENVPRDRKLAEFYLNQCLALNFEPAVNAVKDVVKKM